jgi:hypothetical protein
MARPQIATRAGIRRGRTPRLSGVRAPLPAAGPRLGGTSFLHRFGSALNHHVHLQACVTDGVFVPAADQAGCEAPPTFPTLPTAKPIWPNSPSGCGVA